VTETVLRAPRLSFEAVARRYASQIALDGVNLEIPAGQQVALIGPSGSGKSTILALASGALCPSEGAVAIDGCDIASLNHRSLLQHRRRCGIVPQGGGLVDQLSVHDSVIAGMLAHWPWYRVLWSRLRTLERERVATWLSKVGLASRQESRVNELSGGEKQRVAVARGLVGEAPLLLVDEPTSSLDPRLGEQIADLIFDQARRGQSTLLFATHWVSLARQRATRIVGLRSGRIVIDAPREDVTDDDIERLYAGSDERH
jgi:phosphonate transport system ATP-binding protein